MKENTIFTNLNDKQKQAVLTTDGPLLIIAGPGSGKTRTLVARTIFLIIEKKILPKNIMISTFTEKAAAELISRVSDALLEMGIKGVNVNDMYIGTLHSIFLRILKENSDFTRLKKSYRLLDEFDQQYFVYKNLKNYLAIEGIDNIIGNPQTSRWNKSETLMEWINKVSEEMLDVEKLIISKDEQISIIGKCYKQYIKELTEENTLDFSTIQSETFNLLTSQPIILKKLQAEIKYVMVDEYQDTNTVQELILLKLAENHNNICVVGDDDQGLYRFRGATIRNILEFKQNFQKDVCKEIKLETNYRSHPDIIDFYSKWMELQPEGWEEKGKKFRYPKKIAPPKDTTFNNYTSVIKISGKNDKDSWPKEVLSFLQLLKKDGKLTDYNQIAFLFKSVKNNNAISLANYLETNGIPIFSPRSAMFFDREEIKLLIGAFIFMFPQYQKLREQPNHHELEIWKYYDSCFEEFAKEIENKQNEDLHIWVAKTGKIHANLKANTDYAFSGILYRLIQFPLFRKYFDIDISGIATDVRPLYNLSLFSRLLTKYEYLEKIPNVFTPDRIDRHIKDIFDGYLRYLKDGGIAEYEDFDEVVPSGCVSFMTIHQAKGLEFPIVFVDSLYARPIKQHSEIDKILQGNFYRKQPFEPIEKTKYFDFWRLYYTAFSRAQNLLVLTCQEKDGRWKTPSKYFKSIYDTIPYRKDKSVKLDKLELAKTKEVTVKNEFSFTSHIAVYENCPLQYKYYKELEFAPVRQGAIIFGVLIHQTIEDIHKHAIRGETDKINKECISEWFEQNYSSLSKSERSYLNEPVKKVALRQVLKYVDRHKDSWDTIKEAEVEVSLVKDQYILKGKIDLIKGKNGTVEIIDFKSGDKPDIENDSDALDRNKRQLEVYSHLVEQLTGEIVSRMHLYYTKEEKGNPYISFEKKNLSVENTIKEFDTIVNKIESQDFSIKERPKKICGDCDMRFYCDSK
jgi:DNA helicase-2/ATP-dependent DNA helicase PcrA